MFAVSSVLVTGTADAILIDTQFSAADARQLARQNKSIWQASEGYLYQSW